MFELVIKCRDGEDTRMTMRNVYAVVRRRKKKFGAETC